jgi:rRNA maturation endonuclease Nob1
MKTKHDQIIIDSVFNCRKCGFEVKHYYKNDPTEKGVCKSCGSEYWTFTYLTEDKWVYSDQKHS